MNPPKDFSQIIEELKASAAEIAEEKAKTDAMFLSIGDGAISTDETAKINRINQVALDLLGCTKKELMGAWLPKAIVATDENGVEISSISRPITQAFLTGRSVSTRTFYKKKDGTLLPVALTVSPIILDERPVGAVEVFRDITKELEVDRTKSEFISIASHQLRTPATAVKNLIGLLREGYAGKLTGEQLEYINLAYESNERQLEIVNDLLNVARSESGTLIIRPKRINVSTLVNEVVQEQISTIKQRKQSISVNLPSKPITVDADPTYLRMVLDNLINNASKYTPNGGKISIHAKETTKTIKIVVKDTGVGIDKEDMHRLFLKFSRIENPLTTNVSGSGIGLYLLKRIIDLHKGRVEVNSELGKGSEFIITIPKGLKMPTK